MSPLTTVTPVSYTHLDVYKRQHKHSADEAALHTSQHLLQAHAGHASAGTHILRSTYNVVFLSLIHI